MASRRPNCSSSTPMTLTLSSRPNPMPRPVPSLNLSPVKGEQHQQAPAKNRKLPSILLTPTLQTSTDTVCRRLIKSATKWASPCQSTLTPNALGIRPNRRPSLSPSAAKRLNSQDRLIPSRSLTDLELAGHLLSPLSLARWPLGRCTPEDGADAASAAAADDDGSGCDNDGRVHHGRILQFSSSSSATSGMGRRGRGRDADDMAPLSVLNKPKLKIPTKPDRIMAAPGTFLQYGFQSAHWSPSSMLVVALESGVYICKVNEDCNVMEIKSNGADPENPFYHVLWNSTGQSVVCGKLTGQVHLCDLKQPHCCIQWQLETKHFLRSVALERDTLLTCGTEAHGVSVYDVRLSGSQASSQPVWRLKSGRDPRLSVNSLSWAPNGTTLACGSQSGLVHLWDVRQPLKEMVVHEAQKGNPVQVLDWCPWKPSLLVSGSGYPRPSICLLNTATGSVQCQVECTSEVTGIQFNGELKQIATSHNTNAHLPSIYTPRTDTRYGADSSVELWRHRRNKLCSQLTLGQHENGIISMAISPDQSQLLTMGGDELLCLWQWCDANAATRADPLLAGRLQVRSKLDFSTLIR